MKKIFPHALFSILLFVFLSQGLGYRYLWSDEIETAERGRLITESGLPLVIDQKGVPSVNTGGREIEETNLHRYTPWLQFYTAALGLAVGNHLGWSPDFAVRAPFVAAHSIAMGTLTYSLTSFLATPVKVSLAVGTLIGLQSSRALHNRTARYHALLDLITSLGLLALAGLRSGRRWAPGLLGVALFLPFHTHTLGGATVAALLATVALCLLIFSKENFSFSRWKIFWLSMVLPSVISVGLLMALTRPWLQSHWGKLEMASPRTAFHPPSLLYAFLFAILWSFVIRKRQQSKQWWMPLLVSTVGILIICFFDFHPFSQIRYYRAVALICLFWPLYTPMVESLLSLKKVHLQIIKSLLVVLLLVEFALGRATGEELYWPLQGIRVVLHDKAQEQAGTRQPFHQAIDQIRAQAAPNDAILINYVPQHANWYLPGHPIALMPDPQSQTDLGRNHPIWRQLPPLPDWHLWYPTLATGTWDCAKKCDLQIENYDAKQGQYTVVSQSSGRRQKMCVVQVWTTHPMVNAPFAILTPEAFKPEGEHWGPLVLAKKCEVKL